jgi:hypothetical protein
MNHEYNFAYDKYDAFKKEYPITQQLNFSIEKTLIMFYILLKYWYFHNIWILFRNNKHMKWCLLKHILNSMINKASRCNLECWLRSDIQ